MTNPQRMSTTFSRNFTSYYVEKALKQIIPFRESNLETIDRAFYEWVRAYDLQANTGKGFKPIPVVWVSAERAFLAKKEKETRDSEGALNYPIITIERSEVVKDPNRKGSVWANVPPVNDEKGGIDTIVIGRKINQDRTTSFENADAKARYSQINFVGKPKKTVYQTISIPIPVYVNVTYKVKIKTQFQQQMNELVQPFVVRPGQINYQLIKYEKHRFEAFIQQDFVHNNNIDNMADEERTYETEINVRVLGYLIGAGENEKQPTVILRENAVDVKFPNERIISGEIAEWERHDGFVGIATIFGGKPDTKKEVS